jgi:GxxExxY protein
MDQFSHENKDNDYNKTYNIIGAAMAVHKELGNGFLKAVYGDALEMEFKERGFPFVREQEIAIAYKGHQLSHKYFADFICYKDIIVELKAVDSISSAHRSQIINYLHATGYEIGLLINFGETSLKFERFKH